MAELVSKFQEFCTLAGSKDKTQMTSKASGKLAQDCLNSDYKKYEVTKICDASVFPALKEKGKPYMIVNAENVEKFVLKTAHEIAKRKSGNNKIAVDDAITLEIKTKITACIAGGGPNVKVVEESKTGNVGGLTDTSKYTGAHKERFDEDGKGKGLEGRMEEANTSGYVGNYKGEGTHDKDKT